MEESLFADLPSERRLAELPETLGPAELALRANLAMVQSLLRQALRVRIACVGNSRALVRHAKLWGLLCHVESGSSGNTVLEVSGPFSILKKTVIYGRALAGLIPYLAWCDRFLLSADCIIDHRKFELRVKTGDPIFPAAKPKRFDSRLEERFAKHFMNAAPEWDLIREPEPIRTCGTLIFPIF